MIRCFLLAIPVDQSLLYFEPVYLQADQGALPELKRVIVAFKNTIVMRQTLPEALEAVFGNSTPSSVTTTTSANANTNAPAGNKPPSPPIATLSGSPAELVEAAIEAYERGENALQNGDWAAYGQSQRRLGEILQQLNGDEPDVPARKPELESSAKPEPKPTP